MSKLQKQNPKKALALLRRIEAIYILTNQLTIHNEREIHGLRNTLPQMSNNKARKVVDQLSGDLKRLRHNYGAKVPDTILLSLLKRVEATPEEKIFLCPKYILKTAFARYPMTNFDLLPEHAAIAISTKAGNATIEVHTVETILFEEMCALFNEAKKATQISLADATKRQLKSRNALTRATLLASYYFVEAYLNGLATDHYYANYNLNEKDMSALTEGQKTMSVREKLLQYPKIILGCKHPPLQESNCPEMAVLTGKAKDMRNAIVHASAIPNLENYVPEKAQLIFGLTFEETEGVVDSAISLVRKLEALVKGNCDRINWLCNRAEDGSFSEKTFD